MAWMTASQPPAAFARSLGWFTLAMQLGNTLGPAAAGVLLSWLSTKQTFLVTAAVLLPTFGFLLLAPNAGRAVGQAPFTGRMLELLRRGGILSIAAVFLMTGMAWGIFQSYYALFGTTGLRLSATTVGLLIALSAIVGAVSRIPAGRLLGRLQGKEPQTLMISTAGVGLTLILLPHAGGLLGAGLAAVAFSPLVSVAQLSAAVALTSRAEPESKASALSIYTLVFNLGWGAGVTAFSPFMQAGFLQGFSASGATCALVGVVALVAGRLRGRIRAGPPR
jgi:predicted MFS family arabinose efflux permease